MFPENIVQATFQQRQTEYIAIKPKVFAYKILENFNVKYLVNT